MSLTKTAISKNSKQTVKALNRPKGWEIFNLPPMIKTAAMNKSDEDLHGFDLEAAVNDHPEHLYLKIFAIQENEMNDNGDYFSAEELEKSAETFVGVPIFTNHENDDVEKARGDCVHAWYDKDAGGIYIIARVDKVAYPKLARGIEEGFIKGTSMGCSVEYSICSICHNKAHTADEYCTHIRNSKTRKFNGRSSCKYKKSSCGPDDDCPICGGKETKEAMSHEDMEVFEYNYGLKFIENSFVVNPACHDCGVTCVLHVPELEKKVASLRESVNKLVKSSNLKKTNKTAGQQELDMLKSAMDNMESVVKSMMTQKEQIDMEYVSELVQAMADVQSTVDELMDMGYAQLPSPEGLEANAGAPQPFPDPVQQPEQPQMQPVQSSETGSAMHEDLLGGLGSITKPKAASVFINKKKDFIKVASNLISKAKELRDHDQSNKRSDKVANVTTHIWSNPEDPSSVNVMIDDDFVIEAKGEEVIKASKISELSTELQELISSDPKVAAEKLLSGRIKESNMKQENEKTAQAGPQGGGEASQREVITEKQLNSHPPTHHPRQGKTYETITQDQIGEKSNEMSDTTSDSPQTRSGTYETITEDQMASAGGNEIVRWNDAPEVITEKQWTDVSREVRAALPDDWLETITEDQLRNLLENHRFVGTYETITENQLKNQDWGIKRWANKAYTKALLKVALNAVADVIHTYQKTPDELSAIVARIDDDDKFKNKVAFLTLINAVNSKKEARKVAASKATYFRKKASQDYSPHATEALILAVASAAQDGLKVEDVYETIGHVLSKKEAMTQVESKVEKLSKIEDTFDKVDKFAALDDSIETLDGVEIRTTVAEVGADPKDKKAFVTACRKYAQEMAGDDAMTLLEVKMDPASGAVIIELGEGAELDEGFEPEVDEFDFTEDLEGDTEVEPVDEGVEEENEDCAPCNKPAMPGEQQSQVPEQQTEVQLQEQRRAARKGTVKEAQLMGGEMGGQGGASQMPGAGASLPQPPMNEGPAVESFTDEPSALDEGGAGGSLMPKPPGTTCPVCTSDDVDVVAGKFSCNNCGSKGIIKISLEISEWADLTGGAGEEGVEGEEGIEGEGFELPEGDVAPEMPVAAMVRMNPNSLKKLASIKEEVKKAIEAGDDEAISNMTKAVDEGGTGIPEANLRAMAEQDSPFGSFSPITGTTRTLKVDKDTYVDLAAGQTYKVRVAGTAKGKDVYAQWEWTPKHPKNICPSCRRARKRFASALEEVGLNEKEFDSQSVAEKAKTILAMKKAGALKAIKTADKNGSVIEDYKKAYGVYGDQFPTEACREKLARRYGKNALALSGPCEGQPIHDCVCKSLSNAGVYSDNLATKVASIWADKDGTEDCIEDQVRHGLNIRSAAVVCSALKTAIASDEDFLADDLGGGDEFGGDEPPLDEGPVDDFDTDPFDSGEDLGGGTITVELDADLAEQLDAQLDVALGESPEELAEEGHHDPETVDDIAEDGVADVTDGLGEAAGDDGDAMLDDLAGKPCNDAGGEMMPAKPAMPGEAGQEIPGTNKGISPEVVVKKKDTGPADQEDLGFKPGQPGMSMASAEYTEVEGRRMASRMGNTGKISLDLSSVIATLNKQAGEKTIQQELVQDSGDIGQYSAGDPLGSDLPSAMFHENESVPTAKHPSVPRSDARMGHEDENIDKDETLPNIPSDKGTMGHEDEVGLSGGDARFTGGTGAGGAGSPGAGQSEVEAAADADFKLAQELASMKGVVGNAKQRTDSLVERLLAIREAGKLEEKKPVADDKDIAPVDGGGKGIGHEPKFTADTPENTEGSGDESQMGHEGESMGSRPTSPKDHPEIPEDDARMGHEEEDLKPEKQLKDKGTVIAGGDEESEVQGKSSQDEAIRVAGRMLEAGVIKSNELPKKVAELARYELGQIQDIEKAMFSKARKGLDAASEGIERPLVVSEAASDRSQTIEVKDASQRQAELVNKLTDMFTLGKRNKKASEDPDYELRKTFGQS